jgi:surface protein
MKHLLLLLTTLALFSAVQAQKDTNDFVTTWITYYPGPGGDSTVIIFTDSNYTYNFDVDWDNDGVFDSLGVTNTIVKQYSDTGTYTIRIRGQFPHFRSFITPYTPTNLYNWYDNGKLLSVDQWGGIAWQSLKYSFWGCVLMNIKATDTPDLSLGPNCDYSFAHTWNALPGLTNINVSQVTSMEGMFMGARIPPSLTHVDLNNWDVSNVTNMRRMFFYSRDSIVVENWNVSRVNDMSDMFKEAIDFDSDIRNWDVSSVKDMRRMFFYAQSFNADISNWTVDSVTNMSDMFNGCYNFNQNIGKWNISSVTDMSGMFDIRNPNGLNLGGAVPMQVSTFDSILIGWQAQTHQLNVTLGAFDLKYCNGAAARTSLIADGWLISGDTLDCSIVGIEKNNVQETKSLFRAFPNPNHGLLEIEIMGSIDISLPRQIVLYNSQGKIVKKEPVSSRNFQLQLNDLKNGIYFLRYNNEMKKIILTK